MFMMFIGNISVLRGLVEGIFCLLRATCGCHVNLIQVDGDTATE